MCYSHNDVGQVDVWARIIHSCRMSSNTDCAGRSPLKPFVDWLDSHGQERLAGLADDLFTDVPELAGSAPDIVEHLRASIVSHLPGLRTTLLNGSHRPELPETARKFAQSMARMQTPLSAILRSYELGHSAIWYALTTQLQGETEYSFSQRAEALEIGSVRLFSYMQTMTGETISFYNQTRDSMIRQVNSRRKEIIRTILAGGGSEQDLDTHFNYHVNNANIGFVAWSHDSISGLDIAETVRRIIAEYAQQQISVPSGASGIHGWFSPRNDKAYDELATILLPADIGLTFGAPRHGLIGFRHSHNEAILTTALATTALTHPVRFTDVSVAVLASQNHDLAIRFVNDQLGPLLNHADRNRLLPTLQHYLATLASPTRCATRLGVHPNTVSQRIERIENILDVRVDPGSLSLRLALCLVPVVDTNTTDHLQPASW